MLLKKTHTKKKIEKNSLIIMFFTRQWFDLLSRIIKEREREKGRERKGERERER